MPFPEFEPGKKKILFFSRGRGRGHAIPDIEIVKELQRLRDDLDVRFASYGTGARTFESFDLPLIDLGLPDKGSTTVVTVLSGKLIGALNPHLVVSHEEFPVLPAAKIFNKPTIFITDFFVEPGLDSMESLQCADRIIFTGNAGLFEEPPWVSGHVEYVGPVLRHFKYTKNDRERARRELGLREAKAVISVLPGSWTESVAPILDVVIEAFDLLEFPSKKLIWVAGQDHDEIEARLGSRDEVRVIERDWQIDRIMAASDTVITKANRMTCLELHAMGVPSVALSPRINRIDDIVVESLDSVYFCEIAALEARGLCQRLEAALQRHLPAAAGIEGNSGRAALCISAVIDKIG